MKINDQEVETRTEPYQGGWRSVAFLPGGQQKASVTCPTREGAEADLAQQLRPSTPQFDPRRRYEAKEIVEALLDPDDPSENIERFAKVIGAENAAKDKTVLTRFKRAVRGYIKWAHTDEEQGKLYDDADLAALRKAQTFAEAEAILAQYESEPSFMYMVRSGYFV